MSGLASYKLLIGGRFRLLRYEYKNATLFTRGRRHAGAASCAAPPSCALTDQVGNERVIPLKLYWQHVSSLTKKTARAKSLPASLGTEPE
ncbi:MAG: hypothetical protein WKG07_00935 [Hymenobacter sp.]